MLKHSAKAHSFLRNLKLYHYAPPGAHGIDIIKLALFDGTRPDGATTYRFQYPVVAPPANFRDPARGQKKWDAVRMTHGVPKYLQIYLSP